MTNAQSPYHDINGVNIAENDTIVTYDRMEYRCQIKESEFIFVSVAGDVYKFSELQHPVIKKVL